MRGEERFDDVLVFALQDGAGRIDHTTARLHEAARVFEHALLDRVDAFEFRGRETPLEVGVATERARPRAGGVDQHAVELAVQATHALVVFAANGDRVHVREARTAHAGGETREALFVDVKGVKAPGRAHESPERQGLPARARAEVAHHFAAARREKARDQLAPFVLHVDFALLINRPLRETGLRRKTQTVGAVGGRVGFDAVRAEFFEDFVARRFEKIHAQVQRRPFLHGGVERGRIFVLRFDEVVEPLREFGAHVRGGLLKVHLEHVFQGTRFGTDRRGRNRIEPVLTRERRERRKARSAVGMHGAHRKAQRRVVAKRVVDPFGDEAAVAHAELWVAAEKELHEDVRGTVQLEDDAERAGEFVDDQVRDANAPGLQGRHALFGRLRARATNEPFAGAFFVATTIGRALAVGAFVFGSGAAGLLHLKRATLRGSVLSHGKNLCCFGNEISRRARGCGPFRRPSPCGRSRGARALRRARERTSDKVGVRERDRARRAGRRRPRAEPARPPDR